MESQSFYILFTLLAVAIGLGIVGYVFKDKPYGKILIALSAIPLLMAGARIFFSIFRSKDLVEALSKVDAKEKEADSLQAEIEADHPKIEQERKQAESAIERADKLVQAELEKYEDGVSKIKKESAGDTNEELKDFFTERANRLNQ